MTEVATRRFDIVTPKTLLSPEVALQRPRLQEALKPAYVGRELARLGEHSQWTREHSERTGIVLDGLYSQFPSLVTDDATPVLAVRAALLHDVGKTEVPLAILDKNGRPSDEEFAVIESHVPHGVDEITPHDAQVAKILGAHHRFQGGRSYPGKAIDPELFDPTDPIAFAQLGLAVADVTDSLYSKRSYKEGWPEDRIIEELTDKFTPYMKDLPADLLTQAVFKSTECLKNGNN